MAESARVKSNAGGIPASAVERANRTASAPREETIEDIAARYRARANEGDAWDAREFQPGDIVEASLHATGRSPHFFQIVANNGKTLQVKRMGVTTVDDDGYGQNGSVMPNPKWIESEIIKARIGKNGYTKINGNYSHRWDGRPSMYFTD